MSQVEKNFSNFFQDLETKSYSEKSGQLLPSELYENIYNKIEKKSFFRKHATNFITSASMVTFLVDNKKNSITWREDFEQDKNEDTASFTSKNISLKTLVCKEIVSWTFFQDYYEDFENYLINKCVDNFLREEEKVFMVGDGKKTPLGISTYIEEQLQKFKENNKITSISLDNYNKTDKESLINLLTSTWNNMPNRYKSDSIWVFHSSFMNKLLGLLGNYVSFNLTSDIPISLFGCPLYFSEYINPKKFIGMFVHLKSVYSIIEKRKEITVLKDQSKFAPDIIFYLMRRIGGDIVDPTGISLMVVE